MNARTTQELASWALGESPSSRTLAHSLSDTEADARQKPPSILSDSEQGEGRDSLDSSRPAVIEEVSEPVSPEEREEHEEQTSKPRPEPSGLSNLIRSAPSKARDYLTSSSSGSYTNEGRPGSPGVVVEDIDTGEVTESTALLPRTRLPEPPRKWKDGAYAERQWVPVKGKWKTVRYELASVWNSIRNPRQWDIRHVSSVALGAVAAVFLGLLLNVLDALSYGKETDLYVGTIA